MVSTPNKIKTFAFMSIQPQILRELKLKCHLFNRIGFIFHLHRIFPWGCASGFLRRIVPDAAPAHNLVLGMPHIQRQLTKELLLQNGKDSDCESDKETTTVLSDGSNNNSLNNLNNNKSASLLIKRLPSIGERVL